MRARQLLAATAAATSLAVVGLAGPAAADHVAEVYVDGTVCVMGGQVTDIGPNLTTTDFQITTKNGRTTGYVCHFSDVPPRSEWYTSSGYLWGGPEHGVHRVSDFWCYTPETPYPTEVRRSEFVVTPSGRATLTCRL